jgi:hypothetical protein
MWLSELPSPVIAAELLTIVTTMLRQAKFLDLIEMMPQIHQFTLVYRRMWKVQGVRLETANVFCQTSFMSSKQTRSHGRVTSETTATIDSVKDIVSSNGT